MSPDKPGFTPKDAAFFNTLGERADTLLSLFHPGAETRVREELNGRAITGTNASTGEAVTIGYILPITSSPKLVQHLLVMNNGSAFKVYPLNSKNI